MRTSDAEIARTMAWTPTPSPSPPQVGLARLAHHYAQPGQAPVAWGGEQAAARGADSIHLIGFKESLYLVSSQMVRQGCAKHQVIEARGERLAVV